MLTPADPGHWTGTKCADFVILLVYSQLRPFSLDYKFARKWGFLHNQM